MSNMRYNLTALARVEILTEFQQQNDNPDNDRAVVCFVVVVVVLMKRNRTFVLEYFKHLCVNCYWGMLQRIIIVLVYAMVL